MNGPHFHKHLRFITKLCLHQRSTVATHRLAIPRKFQGEILVPHAVDSIHAGRAQFLATQFLEVDSHDVHLL